MKGHGSNIDVIFGRRLKEDPHAVMKRGEQGILEKEEREFTVLQYLWRDLWRLEDRLLHLKVRKGKHRKPFP